MSKYLGIIVVDASVSYKSKDDGKVYPEHIMNIINKNGYTKGRTISNTFLGQDWLSEDAFNELFVEIGESTVVTDSLIDKFIKSTSIIKAGEKTTIVVATLVNGFEIVESSSCLDPVNYNEEVGAKICTDRIRSRVGEFLAFALNKGTTSNSSYGKIMYILEELTREISNKFYTVKIDKSDIRRLPDDLCRNGNIIGSIKVLESLVSDIRKSTINGEYTNIEVFINDIKEVIEDLYTFKELDSYKTTIDTIKILVGKLENILNNKDGENNE